MAYEDYTDGWVTQDTASKLTITTNKIVVDGLRDDTIAWHYKDKTAGHFGANFEHTVKGTIYSTSNWSLFGLWGISNVIADMTAWISGTSEALGAHWRYGNEIWLYSCENADSDVTNQGVEDAAQYFKILRTDSTLLTLYMYDDAEMTNLVDTLDVAPPNGRTYQHIFGAVSVEGTRTTRFGYYDIENLDLHEEAPPEANVPAAMYCSRRRRVGH